MVREVKQTSEERLSEPEKERSKERPCVFGLLENCAKKVEPGPS